MKPSRRTVVKGALAAASAAFPAIARAMALPANVRTGSIRDVEHVVILMQENRSFDHYFGTLRGVRGFGDPRALRLRSGDSVFRQPNPVGGSILPFHLDSQTTSASVMDSLDHSWKGSHAEWAHHDVWVKHKSALTMGYFRRDDIPFYHALADAFTIGDNYFCSLHGPTNPNRLFLFSGTSGLAVGAAGPHCIDNVDDGNWTGDRSRDKADFAGWGWTNYAERLTQAGVSWKVYQEHDNYGDNALAYFTRFRGPDADPDLIACGRSIVDGSTAANAEATTAQHLINAVARDAAADRLPQVSWIVAPFAYCEHPEASPQAGEALVSRLLDALTVNPAVWAKTALIINYDENDGFFDHVPAPVAATSPRWGKCNVATTAEAWGEEPLGLGVRVPLVIVSPWTRGGWVCSQLFDHTSVIRFLEMRFGVIEPNITPWRRAVTGDLTTAFDFTSVDAAAPPSLPAVAAHRQGDAIAALRPAAVPPAAQALPVQEIGQRPARALPYDLSVEEDADAGGNALHLTFVNSGTAAAVFHVHAPGGGAGPWYFTVDAGTRVSDRFPATELAVYGPNGFLRQFYGALASPTSPRVRVSPATDRDHLDIRIDNPGTVAASITLRPLAYGGRAQRIALTPRAHRRLRLPIATSAHWYDIAIEMAGGDVVRRFAGHVETGRPSRSDPAIGRELYHAARPAGSKDAERRHAV